MAERAHPLKVASLLLQYPTEPLRAAAAEAGEIEIAPARGRQAARLREFCAWYAATPLAELERRYVDAFDFSKRCSLHLTYHVHGDRRQRGLAMLELKRAYRASGFEPPGDELPDHLPLMLEFAALAPDGAGVVLLEDNRVALELIAGGLRHADSPFAPLVEVVLGSLGRLSAAKLARVRRLAASGPPTEEVGLEPFAPPEVMPPDGATGAARPLVGGRGAAE
jgi:nitrate reductase delta subunit